MQLNGSNIGFGWTYSPTINSIVLNPPGAEGDSVVVRYRVFGGNCAPNLAPTSGISGSGLGSTCEPVVLTDLGASDPDGTLTHWYWSIESAPTASIMQHQWLDASVDGELTFYPDASGTWEVGLVVVDDGGAGAPLVSMPITVAPGGNPANTLPQVTIDQATYIISETSTCTYNSVNGETLLEGCTPCVFQPIDLDASNSHDPDGGWLVHSWSLVGTPATSWHLSGSDQDIASLSWIGGMEMALPGTSAETAQVELLVSDCNGDTVTLHTTVQVQCTAS